MKTQNKPTRGRPQTIAPLIKKNLVHLRTHTPKEFENRFFSEAQPLLKGGVTDDPNIVAAQKRCFYQTILKEKRRALAAGKKVEFQGRVVAGTKKFGWIRTTKAEK
jgi:hypothetical protein